MTGHAGGHAYGDAYGDASDTLTLSGGGTTMVATDELLAQASLVQLLHAEAEGWQARLGRIRLLNSVPAPAWTASDPGLGVFAAARAVDAVEEHSRDLADALVAAAEGYGQAERAVEMFSRLSGVWFGYALGRLAPFLVAGAVPILTAGVVAWLLGSALTGTRPGDVPAAAAAWLKANPRILTNPVTVAMVRVIVSSVDDVAAGVLGIPLPLSFALGDEGLGLLGVTSSAMGVLALARPLGRFRETPVSVARNGKAGPTMPPSGFEDLAARIPPVSDDGPQVRIERYGDAEDAAWVVYIGGTVEWDPVATDQPWDVTSNVVAVADQGAGSYRAVVQAMQEAGIQPGDPVIPVGHSQGGLIAAQVAASGEFNTVAVATFGAPAAQVPVPSDSPTIAVEHSDDLVTAIGGTATDAGDARLFVRREVFANDEVPPDETLPAHSLTNYQETGRLIDASPEPRLQEFRARLTTVLGSTPGEVTLWRGTRVLAGDCALSPSPIAKIRK